MYNIFRIEKWVDRMKKVEKKKSLFKFFIIMLALFVLIDFVMIIMSNVLASSSLMAKYGQDLIIEFFYAIAVLVVMLLFHNAYVFTTKKEKFWPSVCLALPILVVAIFNFVTNLVNLKDFSLANFLNALVLCIFIGVAEEFLCRGWLQNEFIERFSKTRKDVIKSIVLASLIFGLMHIINIGSQPLFETILQIINAFSIAVLLGSVYYKTKNIWSVIFLHAFYDFSIFLGEINLVKDCTYNTPSTGVIITSTISVLLISAFWLLGSAKVLNSCEFEEDRYDKARVNNNLTAAIVISFLLLFIPIHNLVPDYDKYEVCYTYDRTSITEDYTVHYPSYKEYTITESAKVETEEGSYNEQYEIVFTLNNNGTVNVKNENTNIEERLDIKHAIDLEIIPNEEYYDIVIRTTDNESTIYYCHLNKATINNKKTLFEFLTSDEAFKKFELPNVTIGYITLGNEETNYPYMLSNNRDEFIIKNEKLYLIK